MCGTCNRIGGPGESRAAGPQAFLSAATRRGLWLRLTLTDGDELEGLAANDRTLVDGSGLLLTPPDTRSNTQRIYVPRKAIQALEVLGLIGAPGRKRVEPERRGEEQPDLFAGDVEQG